MNLKTIITTALIAGTGLAGVQVHADNMASIAINPATGEVSLSPRWATGNNLAGFHFMAQDLSLGGGANQFYSIKSTAIPSGGDISAFTRYIAASGAATPHADIGSKLTPNAYSALTSADPDIGYGAVNMYFIHRKTSGDYFTAIVPSSGTASAVTDLKPMSGPGGPATLGDSGYFGLTFAAANLGYGLNLFYYLRTDPVSGNTQFGTLDPALLGTSSMKFDLGRGGYQALVFTGTDVGYGTDQMYYLRLDDETGYTILGTMHPLNGRTADIANLGSVYSTVTYVPGDVGFGSSRFYATGAINTTAQTISFAAIADRAISSGSFTVTPTASSALAVTLIMHPDSVGAASISGPVAGVFTVTPTAPGLIILQATQDGQVSPTPYAYNMLRQSFTASGVATLAITTQPTSQTAIAGTTATLTVAGTGTTAVSYQWRKDGTSISGNTSATTATLALPNVQSSDAGNYDVLVTNASGSIASTPVTLTIAPPAPVIAPPASPTPTPVGTPISIPVVVTGTGTSFSATGLPTGVTIDSTTGQISGTPTTAGSWVVTVTATNSTGSSQTTFTITVDPAPSSRIVNFSARALSGPGDQTLIMGFVVSGNGKNLLVRGIGPGLAAYGVNSPLADPMLTLYGRTGAIATNDDWQIGAAQPLGSPSAATGTVLASTAAQFGAFPLAAGSKDSALIYTFNHGAHTTSMVRPNSTTGIALTEIYDIDATSASRLINVAARMNVTGGEGALIAGLVIAGNAPKTVLVRGIGPTLSTVGVTGVLADPMITVYSRFVVTATNDNWETGTSTAAQIISASARVGAFPLASGTKDAALLITLQPGAYTIHVNGVANTTGVALVEVYDAD